MDNKREREQNRHKENHCPVREVGRIDGQLFWFLMASQLQIPVHIYYLYS